MDRATPSTAFANTFYRALELSKKSWLLAIQFPDREQPSLYPCAKASRMTRSRHQARPLACKGLTMPAPAEPAEPILYYI